MTITSQLARISWETHSLCSLLQDKNIFHFLLQSIKIWGAKHVENMSAEWQKMLKMCADTHFAWRLASITLQMTYSKDNSLTTPVSDLVSLNWVIVSWPKLWHSYKRSCNCVQLLTRLQFLSTTTNAISSHLTTVTATTSHTMSTTVSATANDWFQPSTSASADDGFYTTQKDRVQGK